MEVDLFGERIPPPKIRPKKHVEVFSAGDDLSEGERLIVAGFMVDMAAGLLADNPKLAAKIQLEADRYNQCGKAAMILQCKDDFSRYWKKLFCHARICERCGRILVKQLKQTIMPVISDAVRSGRRGFVLSQLTLTVTSKRFGDGLPDREGIKRLYRESGELLKLYYGKYVCRRSKSGKVVEVRRPKKKLKAGEDSRQFLGAGWVATWEIGRDNNNAHVHALTWGPIRNWRQLRHDWSMLTKDSFGVDIRQKSLKQALDYVLKYIAKPPASDSYSRLAQYSQVIKGSRRLRTGGIFYNRFKMSRRERRPNCCPICGGKLLFDGLASDFSTLDYPEHRRESSDFSSVN